MGVDVSATSPTCVRAEPAAASVSTRVDSAVEESIVPGPSSNVLPPLAVARSNSSTNDRPSSSKKPAKAKPREHSRPVTKPRTPTPTTNNARAPTPTTNHGRAPTPALPPLPATPHQKRPPTATTTNTNAASPPTRVKLITYEPTYNSTFQCKLAPLQVAALLKPFWADLLANQLKQVRRHVGEHHLKKLDFNAANVRYAANADATPLHLCAQYGLLAMAKLLVAGFALTATLRNKVGSTPLHVACKFGKREIVAWLVDELQVPLDVPDAQLRLALDVAPFDTVDKCVLAPLQRQLACLKQREAELVDEHEGAQQRFDAAQLAFRRNAMLLCDTESHADELREEIEQVSALERHWHDQWQIRSAELDELVAQYDQQKQDLVEEEQQAHDLFEQEVKAGRDDNENGQQQLDELQALVDTTQRELDRRKQLLVDQLGVFDAALREFGGSRDVQQWALAILLTIAHDESGDAAGEVDRTELLLRAEPVAVVRHVFATFSTDYELQYEALELLVAVLRLHGSRGESASDVFVAAVADSDLLLVLGDVLARWYGSAGATGSFPTSPITLKTFEAMYLCLGLRRNAQRVLSFCQQKAVQLTALTAIERISSCVDKTSSPSKPLLRYAGRVLLTQTKYGVKKVLLNAGAVRIVFETLRRISIDQGKREEETADTSEPETEAAQYLFATLALFTSSYGRGDTNRDKRGKCRESMRLEDLTADTDSIGASVVMDCIRVCVLPFAHHPSAVPATLWAFKLLINFAHHGGETALRIREEIQLETTSLARHEDPLAITLRGVQLALSACSSVTVREINVQAVLAGLELVRVVWIERFDHEGRVLPACAEVVRSVPETTAGLTQHLLVDSFVNAASVLSDLAGSLHALASIAQNPQNAAVLITLTTEHDILKPILQWTLRYVDETGASYREPNLVALLVRVLTLFLLLTHARRLTQSALLQAASDSQVASFYRGLHTQSRAIGVCAVLRVFQTADGTHTNEPTPSEWTALRALCSQIQSLTHCSC